MENKKVILTEEELERVKRMAEERFTDRRGSVAYKGKLECNGEGDRPHCSCNKCIELRDKIGGLDQLGNYIPWDCEGNGWNMLCSCDKCRKETLDMDKECGDVYSYYRDMGIDISNNID
jgi:hypothetical protein